MRTVYAFATAGALAVSLAGCGASSAEHVGGDAIAPVTLSVNDLQGENIDLTVGQMLNITTDGEAVDSYSGEVEDSEVAEFTPGRIDDSAEFNPGVTALAAGSSEVTLTNERGESQPLTFTVVVTAAQ